MILLMPTWGMGSVDMAASRDYALAPVRDEDARGWRRWAGASVAPEVELTRARLAPVPRNGQPRAHADDAVCACTRYFLRATTRCASTSRASKNKRSSAEKRTCSTT